MGPRVGDQPFQSFTPPTRGEDRIMPDLKTLVDELKRTRDEIKLKIHLGTKDLQQEWSELEQRWTMFDNKAELDRSAKDVSDAVRILGSELKDAFLRVRKAL
jgi:hypothetical protein